MATARCVCASLVLLIWASAARGYGSCCVGGYALGVCVGETYDDNFFLAYNCVGASGGGLAVCDSCDPALTGLAWFLVIGVPLLLLSICMLGCVILCCCCRRASGPVIIQHQPPPLQQYQTLLSPGQASINAYGTQ